MKKDNSAVAIVLFFIGVVIFSGAILMIFSE